MVGICEHLCNLCESRPSGLEGTLGESPDIIENKNLLPGWSIVPDGMK